MAQNINCIFVSGYGANHPELLPLGNTPANIVASSEDAAYPATNQINRHAIKPWKRWKTQAGAEDAEVVIDKNQIFNGGFEGNTLGDTFANGWEADAVSIVNSPVHSGSLALQFGAAEAGPFALQTTVGRAGEKVTVEAALEGLSGGSGVINVYIEDLGLWLNADGVTWQDTETAWFSRGSNQAMLFKSSSPVMPAYHQQVPGGVFTVTIDVSGNDFVLDSVAFWHWTDMAGIAGHNVHPIISSTDLEASTDNSTFTTVKSWLNEDANPLNVLIWPTTFALFTLRGERWWRFLFNGTNDQVIVIGQFMLAQRYVLTRKPNYGIRFSVARQQRRNETPAGADWVHVREDVERREFAFKFHYQLEEQWREARNRLLRQGVFGKHPIVMIYDDTNADSFAMVRQPGRFDYTQPYIQGRHAEDFVVTELAFPTGD